jgi:type IV pilus assembly protein PilM
MRLEVTDEQAEVLKQQRGLGSQPATSKLDFDSIEVIRTSALELLTSLRNTLNFYTGAHAGQAVQAIVLTGGGARLSGLAQALGDMTRVQVIEAQPFSTIDVARSLKSATADREAMTVALGLALGSAA